MKKILSILILIFILFFCTIFTCFAQNTTSSNSEPQANSATLEPTPLPQPSYHVPQEVKGVVIKPGIDFATQAMQDASQVEKQIDAIISDIEQWGFNTIYLYVNHEDGVIYPSSLLPMYTSFDALNYFLSKAKQKELYVYTVINPTYQLKGELLFKNTSLNSQVVLSAQEVYTEFISKYAPDCVLITGYYNQMNEKSFQDYKLYGSGMGFEQWMLENATSLIKSLSELTQKYQYNTQFGLVCDAVWANKKNNPNGSATSADTQLLYDYYVDLETIFVVSNIQHVLVQLPGALTDSKIPFKTTLSWWVSMAKNHSIDVTAAVYNNYLGSKNKGWNSPDQVLRQLITTREVNGCKGAAFVSYPDLKKNTSNTDLIVKFYKNQIKAQDILTDLSISRPTDLVYSTNEPTVSFYGASDPNFPLLLNDKEVERNEKGVFSLELDLAAGENRFTFTHKTKTVTYKITRNIKIISSVAPEGALTVEGNAIVPISVYAYQGSSVTANIGGTTLTLVESTAESDNTNKDSNYVLYTANFNCPAAQASQIEVGNIQISATWQGTTQTATGAMIRVTGLPPEVEVGQKGNMIEVTASQARTYPSSVINADPAGDCFPLPKGSRDFIASDLLSFTSGGKNYNYYILKSGVRVSANDIQIIGEAELTSNNLTYASIYTEGGFTYLKLKQDQPMAFKAYLPGLGFDISSGISAFNSGELKIYFQNIEGLASVEVADNALFAGASMAKEGTQGVITLNFKKAGRFAGYRAYYEGEYLIFRFTHVPTSLNGARIYLDPGHGGYDSGAIPIEGMKSEATLNYEMASKVADILRAQGADVRITDCALNFVSLDNRVSLSQSYAPHLFVSLHHNSSTSPNASGTEAWFFNPYSECYADLISSRVAGALGTKDRGEKYGLYRVTTHMEFPAVLVEYGFLSNVSEYDKLKDSNYQQSMAQATVDAISAVFAQLQ